MKSIELLTASVGDYVASQGKKRTDYEMIGVSGESTENRSKAETQMLELAKNDNCEVIVKVKYDSNVSKPLFGPAYTEYLVAGTGLRLKNK